MDTFNFSSPMKVIAQFISLISKTSVEFDKQYLSIILTRQLLRAGKYVDAHKSMNDFKPKQPDVSEGASKEVMLYFEWVLVAKKVLFKELF